MASRSRLASLLAPQTFASGRSALRAAVALLAAVTTLAAAPDSELPASPQTGALRAAIEDLANRCGATYPNAAAYLRRLEEIEKAAPATPEERAALAARFTALQREALLADPALDFDRVLLVRRKASNLALPANWQGNSSIKGEVANAIVELSLRDTAAGFKPVYAPASPVFVGDLSLGYDADRLLFSSIGANGRWHVFELLLDAAGRPAGAPRQITPSTENDVDSYDATYLPDGGIAYVSTSGYQGVPCVGGADHVGNLHRMNADGTGIRRLCFDQEHNWSPRVMPDGRLMYQRWEYTDSSHYFSRLMMRMNPDGTEQGELYGSNSYWPNAMFYARPLPGDPERFVAIVSGHHGVPRMGELVLFDITRGRRSTSGAVQRIPGRGRPVEPAFKDGLVENSWPKFLHPYPLGATRFLVSGLKEKNGNWGLYLVDTFDNVVLLHEEPGYALFEPIPLRKTTRPPVLVDRTVPGRTTASAYIHDIYAGPGLAGVPRGTVKSLRIFQYEFAYRQMGGHYAVGIEGPWDVRRIIGTVPVYPDGSALFEIPANTPVSIQPLDENGAALQQLRSWFTAMPGEVLSCAGCHEPQNSAPASTPAIAATKLPVKPTEWYGPKRGFSFVREVQGVLDQYCVGCHDAAAAEKGLPDFSDTRIASTGKSMGYFPKSYVALHPYVRRNGPEGDYNLLTPLEFHASTSPLVQLLRKGHHGVVLSPEAWDRLITWMDLNVPAHGTWREINGRAVESSKRRKALGAEYAGLDDDPEQIPPARPRPAFVAPKPPPAPPQPLTLPGYPLTTASAEAAQRALGKIADELPLGGGQSLKLVRVPAGRFVMGDVTGAPNEYPQSIVSIEKPFWIGATEVTLAQYQQFDPDQRNGYYDMHYKDQTAPGYLMDGPDKPVIRVSQERALAFCQWLSKRTGRRVTLPTEAQWEYAARAGTASPFYYGDLDTDFATFANLADVSLRKLAVTGINPQPIENPDRFWDFVPKDARFNDGVVHLSDVGHYKPNPWGLFDMIGNVGEWTRSPYLPYPYKPAAEDAKAPAGEIVVRGGSWFERPKDATASSRWGYPGWQRVHNVGFRVIVED